MMMQGNILQRRPPKRRFLRARAAVALVIVLQGVSLLFVPFNRTATSLQLANNATNTRLSTKLKQSNHLLPIDRSSIRSNDDVQSRKTQRNRKEESNSLLGDDNITIHKERDNPTTKKLKAMKVIKSFFHNITQINSTPTISTAEANNKSSVDYFACCGLGHRLTKMGHANIVAKLKNWALRVYWGTCPGKDKKNVEIFEYFFGPQPLRELVNVSSTGKFLRIANDVRGFKYLTRVENPTTCQCTSQITEIHNQFYFSLRDERFQFRQEVADYVHQYFDNYTVIGLHVRAGNGEKGDFKQKKRVILDVRSWIHNVAQELIRLSLTFSSPPRLFVATDTPSIITGLQEALKNTTITVIEYMQNRPAEGTGVLFGENFRQNAFQGECLGHWKNALMDLMIISHADVVISGRPSSFTQSLPMSVALAKAKHLRKVPYTYCEMNPSGSETRCYQDFQEWCCNGTTKFHMGKGVWYEYRKTPPKTFGKVEVDIRDRNGKEYPMSVAACPKRCSLPYQWG